MAHDAVAAETLLFRKCTTLEAASARQASVQVHTCRSRRFRRSHSDASFPPTIFSNTFVRVSTTASCCLYHRSRFGHLTKLMCTAAECCPYRRWLSAQVSLVYSIQQILIRVPGTRGITTTLWASGPRKCHAPGGAAEAVRVGCFDLLETKSH